METKQEEKPTPDDGAEKPDDAILLRDLAPRQDVKGGSGKVRFGESTVVKSTETP